MDRQTLRHYLAQTDDHIDQATERLERHSRLLEQLKRAGRDTRAAEELMARFEQALESTRSDRQVILNLLDAPKNRRPGNELPPPQTHGTNIQMSHATFDARERRDDSRRIALPDS
ncbi:MAG: hypothetical protein JSS04_06785 [Proteobacteria bacterium]|nr:hypothetical protein [Pseudomonadota bacterium]